MSATLDRAERATRLVEKRDALTEQLPTRCPGARDLPADLQQLIVDESIEWAAVRHDGRVTTAAQLTALFWSACALRVKRAREGRYDTVRAGYERVDAAELERLAEERDGDPLLATLAREQREAMLEVLRALSPRERQVVAVKHMAAGTAGPLGYKRIAKHLGMPVGEVRAAERSIRDKFDRYATAVRGHEAALERKLGQLLPVPPAVEPVRGRIGAWRDLIADLAARPFAGEAASGATQAVASGAGRGAGGALAIKLATLCIGTGGLVGAACVATGVLSAPTRHDPPTPAHEARATPRPTATPRHSGPRERALTRTRAVATAVPTATPTPHVSTRRGSSTQGGTGSRDHERTPASPAPANAAPDGSSEFDPTFQPSQPATPAPVPAAPGANEFF